MKVGDLEFDGDIISPDGATAGATGAALIITAGSGHATSGDGGAVNITAGAGIGAVSGHDGGDIIITPGLPAGAGAGGTVNVITDDMTISKAAGGGNMHLTVEGTAGQFIILHDSNGTADQSKFSFGTANGSTLDIGTANDILGSFSSSLRFHRSGTSISHIESFDPIRFQNGSPSTPVYSFTNAATSGMLFDSTSNSAGPGFSNATSTMLVITANGLRLREATAPSTDVTNFGYIYIDSADANLKFRDESGEVTHIAGSGIATLANSATPTVVGGRLFLTGGTTTITDFTNGYTGQEIIILSEHAITITDGTNMFLSGSANFVMASTDSLHLVQKADGNWYEISRSVN
jgi:hypothetical protein